MLRINVSIPLYRSWPNQRPTLKNNAAGWEVTGGGRAGSAAVPGRNNQDRAPTEEADAILRHGPWTVDQVFGVARLGERQESRELRALRRLAGMFQDLDTVRARTMIVHLGRGGHCRGPSGARWDAPQGRASGGGGGGAQGALGRISFAAGRRGETESRH